MIKVIGITGPSGAGKSLLCGYLTDAGIPCINADELYHSMLNPPSRCLDEIKKVFGAEMILPDGRLDRQALSRCVFGNTDKLELLNRTVLPIVIDEIKRLIKCFEEKGERVAAVDAPTLIESGFYLECDIVVAVTAPESERIERIEERDHISEELARMRANAQKPSSFYTSKAHVTLVNDGNMESLKSKAGKLIKKIKEL